MIFKYVNLGKVLPDDDIVYDSEYIDGYIEAVNSNILKYNYRIGLRRVKGEPTKLILVSKTSLQALVEDRLGEDATEFTGAVLASTYRRVTIEQEYDLLKSVYGNSFIEKNAYYINAIDVLLDIHQNKEELND